jgi:Fe-S cluster biogenesis protein NfuA
MRDIERLIAELERVDPAARATADALIRSLMELHAGAFERIVEIARAHGALDELVKDDLLSSLLLLYDLHPVPLETRVQNALEKVRPYIASHGGGIEVISIAGDVVRVRMAGNCDGCPGSSDTMKLAVEQAIFEAAPEISAVVAD